jgi:hypothetical protein
MSRPSKERDRHPILHIHSDFAVCSYHSINVLLCTICLTPIDALAHDRYAT